MSEARIQCVCGFGCGSSLMLRMAIDDILKKHDLKKIDRILKEKGFSKHSSPIQNYFAWAEQFMDDNTWHVNTERNLWVRNLNGGDFADSLSLASTGLLEDELIPAVINDIAKKSKLAEAEAKLKAEADAKRKEEIRRKNLERAGFGFEFDPEFKNDKSIPDEWIN